MNLRLLAVVFGVLLSRGAWGQTDTVRMLYLGNSYLYCTQTPDRAEVPEKLAALAAANGHTVVWEAKISGGTNFAWHWSQGGADRMRANRYDVVVLQDESEATINAPHAFLDYAERFGALAAQRGQRLLFFMTMGHYARPQMIDTVGVMYGRAARLASAAVVPCGLAWRVAYERYPELKLHHADGSHPVAAGIYMNVYTLYRTIFGEKPKVRVNFDLAGLDDGWYERLEACADQVLKK